jgi:hypothetical protein
VESKKLGHKPAFPSRAADPTGADRDLELVGEHVSALVDDLEVRGDLVIPRTARCHPELKLLVPG